MRHHKGFTLIELAIVVAIIGFISVGFLRIFESLRAQTGRTDSALSLEEAQNALRRFLAENGRLPCPAAPALNTADAQYAREATDGSGSCNGTTLVAIPSAASPTDFAGVLPVRTLGIGGERVTDGWERQITYQVSEQATGPDAFRASVWDANNIVVAASGDCAGGATNAIRAPAVVVIMSHGPNGNGARTVDGAALQQPPVTAANELENTDSDTCFVDAEPSDDATNPFDDLVVTLSERQLIEPLIKEGLLTDRRAIAKTQLEIIAAALFADAIADYDDPDGPPDPLTGPCVNNCRTVRHALRSADSDADGNADPGETLGGVPYRNIGFSNAEAAEIDPWGNPILYRVDPFASSWEEESDPDSSNFGIFSTPAIPTSGGAILRLLSFGPNGQRDTATDDPDFACNVDSGGNSIADRDDRCLTRSFQRLVGEMVASGVPVD